MVRRRMRAGSTNLPLVQLLRGVKNRRSKNGNCFSFISFGNRAEWSPGSEMSGGERKKRIARGTGWEEAGGEFFQESYPGAELDLEALPRDPHYFATLLPSKQTRAATTKKPSKVDNKATYRRRTSTRQRNTSTMAQNNTMPNNDIHVAMMPDLSENLANEETTWEEMMLIKAMPVSMAQKKEIKAKLLSADTFRLQGISRLKWRRRKLWEYLKVRWKELHKKTELWRSSFQTIEGRFGPAVASLFVFIKWMMLLNLTIAATYVVFVVAPTLLIPAIEEECLPSNTTTTSIACCSQLYDKNDTFVLPSIFELLQGTGWLERTHLFYGVYPHTVLEDDVISYNLPVAYMSTCIAIFTVCFLAIIKGGSAGFKERLVESEGQYYKFCSLIFSGWDFCIHSDKGASAKHRALFLELKEWIEEERREEDQKNQTRDEFCRGMLVRVSVHLLVKLIFVAASSLVYIAIQFSQSELQTWSHSEEYRLLLEYAPSLSIIGLNILVPKVLQYLISLEGYTPVNAMRISLVRNLFLRFSLVFVLIMSINSMVDCGVGPDDTCVSRACRTPLCWETFAAQQLYKLIILETVVQVCIVFFINFPRMLLAKHVRCKLARFLGSQEFDLPKHLVDIVYLQFLVWLGSFFMPLMPLIATILLFCTFYVKKFACLVNSLPPTKTVYRMSKSKSMYLLVLLGAYLATLSVLGYTAVTVQPSRSCGPFRGLSTYWSLVQITYGNFPEWFRNVVAVASSSVVAFPALVLLMLLFYYYYILTRENRQMVIVLKKQLVLEGHDKQFLLNRLSAFIKQHQERHKAARSIDPPPANSA